MVLCTSLVVDTQHLLCSTHEHTTNITFRYANASTCNHRYIPNHPAIVIDVPRPSEKQAKKNLEILHTIRKKMAAAATSGLTFV